MTVRDLIDILENFDDDMPVKIGMIQNYGSNFAMEISENNIEEYEINSWDNENYKAVVLTEGIQLGTVDYEGEEDNW